MGGTLNALTCGCEYVDSLILKFCELHQYPGPESHKDGKGIIIRDLEAQIHWLKELLFQAGADIHLKGGHRAASLEECGDVACQKIARNVDEKREGRA